MYKLTFTLKQHTPLIHFQHDQAGATLRATEVKPKLDRFLIERLTEKQGEEAFKAIKANPEWKKWLVGKGEHPALDYKMKIFSKDKNPTYFYFESKIPNREVLSIQEKIKLELELPNLTVVGSSPYFANNDKRNNHEYDKIALGVIHKSIRIEIMAIKKRLLESIEEHLPPLFIKENFGGRQSKGFGCFTDQNTNLDDFTDVLSESYSFSKQLTVSSSSIVNIFRSIDNTYKKLKNKAPDISRIRDYYHEEDIDWEKKLISKEVAQDKIYEPDSEGYDTMFVRALLGLAGLYDYQQLRVKVNIRHETHDTIAIERFQSPIKFKIFNNNIFLVADQNKIDLIKGEWFNFYLGESLDSAERSKRLQVPTEFNVVDFLNKNI